jgi:hypothetical protein
MEDQQKGGNRVWIPFGLSEKRQGRPSYQRLTRKTNKTNVKQFRVYPPQAWFSKEKVPSSGFRVQRLQLLEIPDRRWFDAFQPGTLNWEPFCFLNSKPGTNHFEEKVAFYRRSGLKRLCREVHTLIRQGRPNGSAPQEKRSTGTWSHEQIHENGLSTGITDPKNSTPMAVSPLNGSYL